MLCPHNHRSPFFGFGRCGAGSFGGCVELSATRSFVAPLSARVAAGVSPHSIVSSPAVFAGTVCVPPALLRPPLATLAFTAFSSRRMHLLQLAGPTYRGHASSIQARMSAGSPSVLGSPAFTALRSRSTHLLQLAGPTYRGHASSIQARMSAGSPSVLGSPAFTALRSRSAHLLQLAGPTYRGHASSIQARMSAGSPSVLGSPAFTALRSRSTHLLQLAGPTYRGHASLIQALILAVSASRVSFLEYSLLALWGWIPSPTLLLPAGCASEGTSRALASPPVIVSAAVADGLAGAGISAVVRHPLSTKLPAISMCLCIVGLPSRRGCRTRRSVRCDFAARPPRRRPFCRHARRCGARRSPPGRATG